LQTLDSTLQIFKAIAREKAIELEYNLSNAICVIGDCDMLQLVLRNLIMNAVKFTHPDGKIMIDAVVENDTCIISVHDNGVGMPPSKQATLFSLTAGSTVGTGNEKGAGLGLVLCREFIELQGGKIWCTSKQNEGTTFFISLALCPAEQRATFL
jgi:two-component system sensor histidine kinase/response regulator